MAFADRFLTAPPGFELAGRRIKPYHVNIDDRPIEPAIVAAAHAYLPRLFPETDPTPPASFVIVHRGRSAAYLIAYSWVWDNVLECHAAAAAEPALGCPDLDPTHFVDVRKPWIGCVWELPPLEHERAAWVLHMLVRDPPDLAAYLADTMHPGPVGRARPR